MKSSFAQRAEDGTKSLRDLKPDNTTKLVDRFTMKKGFRTPTKVRKEVKPLIEATR